MKLVEYTDKEGYKHLAWIKDNQPESEAPNGIPANPPDIRSLNWEGLIRDLHNELVTQRLTNWTEVQKRQNAITGIINKVIKRQIISLYRGED